MQAFDASNIIYIKKLVKTNGLVNQAKIVNILAYTTFNRIKKN